MNSFFIIAFLAIVIIVFSKKNIKKLKFIIFMRFVIFCLVRAILISCFISADTYLLNNLQREVTHLILKSNTISRNKATVCYNRTLDILVVNRWYVMYKSIIENIKIVYLMNNASTNQCQVKVATLKDLARSKNVGIKIRFKRSRNTCKYLLDTHVRYLCCRHTRES